MSGRSLTAEDVEAIADEVAARITARSRYLDTAALAEDLGMSEEWVREHAAELGAVRMSDSPRGPLRFERARVERALEARRLKTEAVPARRRRPGPRRRVPGDVELIELPDRAA